ncbi:hypothetical protein SAMN04489726_6534 [Allokutzneria albata]|uniref:Uncharacterized protein n=1 Tax=Allokutzneria albata TaxID=211114 RepID=A0A1H0B8L3_ALLAB|nr:hypothetical protein SAMN04489726_6534 [Allokutzneria albata]
MCPAVLGSRGTSFSKGLSKVEELDAGGIAEVIAAMLRESHNLRTERTGTVVALTDLDLEIAVEEPEHDPAGAYVRLPLGVRCTAWEEGYAWDQAVGVRSAEAHPLADALMSWVDNVLPVFIAIQQPDHPLADAVFHQLGADGEGRPTELFAGPVGWRDFGGIDEGFVDVARRRPPTLVVAERLMREGQLPNRPVWFYSLCGRTSGEADDTVEVVLNNNDVSGHFVDVGEHLPWGSGQGTVKSWALLVPAA